MRTIAIKFQEDRLVRRMTRLIPAMIAALIATGPAWSSEVKSMQCETFFNTKGTEKLDSSFSIRYLAKTNGFEVEVHTSSGTAYHPNDSDQWKVNWKSDNNLHVVATLINSLEENAFSGPLEVLDVNFQTLQYRNMEFGNFQSFDLIARFPKYKCKRLD